MRKYYLTIIAIVCMLSSIKAQSFDSTLTIKLQNALDSIRLADNIKGISTAIIYPGQGHWAGVSGESYLGVPITSNMEFHIASNTKTFTAVMFLKLIEHKLANLDDSLFEWLPNYNPNIDSNITIRQLLNHTSGIANTFDVIGFRDSLSRDWNRVFTPSEILSWLPTPLFAPGSGQSYSNPNYNLTGLVIESVTDQPLEKLFKDSILTILGMDSTFFPIHDTVEGVIAHPWQMGVDWNDTIRTSLLTAQWGAGAMYSTASEMAHWYNELFNNQFLNPAEFNELTTMVGPQKRGLGIQETNIAGRTIWGHGGSTIGYSSAMVFDTTSKAVISVLVNTAPANPLAIAEVLLETLINNPVTGVDNFAEYPNVVIYPNPTSGIFQVDNISFCEEVNIYNSNGKVIYNNYLLNHKEMSFDILDQQNGIYFVHLRLKSNETILFKLVKNE